MRIFNSQSWAWILLVSIILFLIFLPLSLSIDFMQNDDWAYYINLEKFRRGDLTLHPLTAPTFYVQGFLALAYLKFFPHGSVPVLTLIFACLNFFIFSVICKRFLGLNITKSILVGLLLFFNPLHIYSIIGFMGEVYLLTFSLLALYFYYAYLAESSIIKFFLGNLFWIMGFFVKQSIIAYPMGTALWMAIQKKWLMVVLQLSLLMAVLTYYYSWFPKTYAMVALKPFVFARFLYIDFIAANFYACIVYLTIFALPFIATFIFGQYNLLANRPNKIKIIPLILFLVISSGLAISYLNLVINKKAEFPFFGNILVDGRFFNLISIFVPEGTTGGGFYSSVGFYLDEFVLTILITFVVCILLQGKWKAVFVGYEPVIILIGIFLIIGAPGFYDRYLLPLIPVTIFFFVKISDYKINNWLLATFILAQTFISSDYAIEYANRQKLIWHTAERMHSEFVIPRTEIAAGNAWSLYYGVNEPRAKYTFKYPSAFNAEKESILYELESKGLLVNTKILVVKSI